MKKTEKERRALPDNGCPVCDGSGTIVYQSAKEFPMVCPNCSKKTATIYVEGEKHGDVRRLVLDLDLLKKQYWWVVGTVTDTKDDFECKEGLLNFLADLLGEK